MVHYKFVSVLTLLSTFQLHQRQWVEMTEETSASVRADAFIHFTKP